MLTGLGAILTSPWIVFPGLEILLGIETLVGKQSVDYQPDGSYFYTNPVAQMRWIAGVAAIGALVFAGGFRLWRSKQPKPSILQDLDPKISQ